MPAPLLIPLLVKGACWICGTITAGYCVKKAHDAYENNQKTKRDKYGLKSKAIDNAKEDNKKAQEENTELKKKLEDLEKRVEKRNTEIQNLQEKIKDPKLSSQERGELEEKLASLLASQEDDKREKNNILDQLKKLGERIAKNNETINNAGLNPDDKHWVWEFLTLENMILAGGCYMMYKLLKDDK